MRAPAAFAFFAALTLTAAAATAVPLPHYTVAVTLSAKAAEKLSSSGEMVHVNALYYGEAIKPKDGD